MLSTHATLVILLVVCHGKVSAAEQELDPHAYAAVTLGFVTDDVIQAKRAQIKAALCNSAACQSIWLEGFPMQSTPKGIQTSAADDMVNCFLLINATCADCAKEHGAEDVCPHVFFHQQPQPISGHFAFCSGQVLRESRAMSTISWLRFISWRNYNCRGSLERSAWREGVPLPEGRWLPYYEQPRETDGAGPLGWTQSIT